MEDAQVSQLIVETLRCHAESLGISGTTSNPSDTSEAFGEGEDSCSLSYYSYSGTVDSSICIPGISRFNDAIGIIPAAEKAAFVEACCYCPNLIRLESHPRIFLLRHDCNVLLAAQGLVRYWAMRKEIFGERAFLPMNMTGEGALNSEDIEALRTGFLMVLPPDNLGRPVLFTDFSKVGVISDGVVLRTSFFIRSVMLCRKKVATTGYVGIEIYNQELKSMLDRPVAGTLSKMMEEAIPTFAKINYIVKLQRWTFFHLLQSSADSTGGLWKQMTPLIASSVHQLREKLQKLHFDLSSVPEMLGGSWSTRQFDSWFKIQTLVNPTESSAKVPSGPPLSVGGLNERSNMEENDTNLDVGSLVRDIIEAIELIPPESKIAYMEAMTKCPYLVRTESNPVRFLHCESGDTVAAAHRLVRYWESRKKYFKDRAFAPLTFQKGGVFTEGERKRLKDFWTTRILPNDKKGRPVLWWDPKYTRGKQLTLEERYKYWMYIFQKVVEDPGAQKSGVLLICVPNSLNSLNPSTATVQLSAKILKETFLTCFPVKSFETHSVILADQSNERYMSLFLNNVPRGEATTHISKSKNEIRDKLVALAHMERESIPVEFGGRWGKEQGQTWRQYHDQVEEGQHGAFAFQPVPDAVMPKFVETIQDDALFLHTSFHETMNAALAPLPDKDKTFLNHALITCPDIVRAESDPWKYVAVENGSIPKAACRMANYWNLRHQLFEQAAYLPLGSNFENVKTVQDTATVQEGRIQLLPDLDYHGRNVLFIDNVDNFSTTSWHRQAFFMLSPFCVQCDKKQSQEIVVLFRTKLSVSYLENLKHAIEFVNQSFPLKVARLFLCFTTDKDEQIFGASKLSRMQLETVHNVDQALAEMTTVQYTSSAQELAEMMTQDHGFSHDSLLEILERSSRTDARGTTKETPGVESFQRDTGNPFSRSNRSDAHAATSPDQPSQEQNHHMLVHKAILELSSAERSDYELVKDASPNLILAESNPSTFLKFEQMDHQRAAQRLADYWRQRRLVFKELALKPLNQTGEGALAKRDVACMSSGYLALLPNDSRGRAVLLHDSSRLVKNDIQAETRNMFYWAMILLQNKLTIDCGVILITVINGTSLSPQTLRMLEITKQCFPFQFQTMHFILQGACHNITSEFVQSVSSLPGAENACVQVHSFEDALTNLNSSGLDREGLPEKACGGYWSYESFAVWQEQRIRQEWELPLGMVKDGKLLCKAKAYSELTEEERALRKRRFNVLHSRRKRQRARMAEDVLQAKVNQLLEQQQNLLAESERLASLLDSARKLVDIGG